MPPTYITRSSSTHRTRLAMIFDLLKNLNILKIITAHEKVHSLLARVNMELGRMDESDPLFPRRVDELNQAVIDLMKSKWYTDQAVSTGKKSFWKLAFASKDRAISLGEKLLEALLGQSSQPVEFEAASLRQIGETTYTDDVPLVPEINPIVVLQGSDYEMGYQYAQQVVEIFGPAVMARKSGISSKFTADDLTSLREWESQLQQHTPEIIDMARGWAVGASDAGVPMSYEDALDIWTGHLPPARKYLGKGELPFNLPPMACSGVAAWGSATADGRLVAGASGDHDCTHMVTILAFPETGNNFIFSTFSAIGDVPIVGNLYMMGHPGMNNKGVAYVHHGGVSKLVEPQSDWGYGIRRGASIFHNLRFANSARQARDMELTYPVGDVGKDSAGTVGGFYADSTYGFVLESRKNPIILREAGVMGESDFLFANNSPVHPEVKRAGWMQGYQDLWAWDEHAGWYPKKFTPLKVTSLKTKDKLATINGILSLVFSNSAGRNRFSFNYLSRAHGKIDFEILKTIYRVSGRLPEGSFEQIAAGYKQTGEWGQPAIGHAGNALVNVLRPDNGDEGLFAQCVGPARRGLVAHAPYPHCGPVYNETNAFWELKLAGSPEAVLGYAREKALDYVHEAQGFLDRFRQVGPAHDRIDCFFQQAQREIKRADHILASGSEYSRNTQLYRTSRAIRAYTRAQVRAQQVIQAVHKPSQAPEIDF